MTQKIVTSKAGFDAGTETNPNNLIYSSDYNSLKYFDAGTVQLIGTSTGGFETEKFGTITHNLGYHPYVSIFISSQADSTRYYLNSFNNHGAGGITEMATGLIGTAVIRFHLLLQSAPSGTLIGTYTYYYKIFRNNTGL